MSYQERMEQYILERNNLQTKSTLENIQELCMSKLGGVAINEIASFTEELHSLVDQMKESHVNENRVLEGLELPEYGKGDWSIPVIQNEHTESKEYDEQQWKMPLPFGFSTISRIHTSTPESNISSYTAEPLNLNLVTEGLNVKHVNVPIRYCKEMLDVSGSEIDVTNESSECTVPMINEQMHGTPNEEK